MTDDEAKSTGKQGAVGVPVEPIVISVANEGNI